MNEVKKVHLGRQPFTIAVDAHKELREYLQAIEKQPGVQPEVAKEVEMRMAELLTERGISADKVVLQEDVDFLKQQLGQPRDFKDEDGEGGKEETEQAAKQDEEQPKRLFRDTQHGMIAGVSSGLAAYLGIDVILVRIVFVALTVASGAGILLYVLIWLLAPEAKTPSERLQMQGKAVTVDSLKEMVDRADLAGVSQRAGRNVSKGLGRVVEIIFQVVAAIIGAGFVTAGVVTMLWIVAAGVYLLIHGGQIGTEIAFPLGSYEAWFVILAFVTTAILGFFMVTLGITMITRKWRLPGWLTAALVGIFFVAASVGTALGFDAVPQVRDRFRAAHHSQKRDLQEFNKVHLAGKDTTFRFKPDSAYYVELSYLGNVDTKPLTTTVDNKTLTVNSADFVKTPLCTGLCFYGDHDLVVTIHAPALEDISLTGTENSFLVDSPLTQQDMTIEVRRGGENEVRLGYVKAAVAEVIDDDKTDWKLALFGVKTDTKSSDSTIHFDEDNDVIRVDDVAVFRLKTTNTCVENEPLVYVRGTTEEVQVNDQAPIKEARALRDLRTRDDHSVYNCIVWR